MWASQRERFAMGQAREKQKFELKRKELENKDESKRTIFNFTKTKRCSFKRYLA